MSIINDAIKKARKESDIKNQPVITKSVGRLSENKVTTALPFSGIRWLAVVTVSLVIVVSFFGSLALYKHIVKLNMPAILPPQTQEHLPSPSDYQKTTLPVPREEYTLELNGIVCGPEDKWAIINNRIAREGNSLPGGKLTHIAKDFVKIKKDTGEELILDLR